MKCIFRLKVEAWKPNMRSKNFGSSLEKVDFRNALGQFLTIFVQNVTTASEEPFWYI